MRLTWNHCGNVRSHRKQYLDEWIIRVCRSSPINIAFSGSTDEFVHLKFAYSGKTLHVTLIYEISVAGEGVFITNILTMRKGFGRAH